jgi:hypothetical protein
MKKTFLGLSALMFILFAVSSHSVADNSSGNGSPHMNQSESLENVYQFQFQQSNPLNESGSGNSPETPAGARNGTLGVGPFLNVTDADFFTVLGKVVGCLPGNGLEMVVCDENDLCNNMYVFGIGPNWFWERLGIERPAVDDGILVEGYTVNYSGTLRNIATVITFPPPISHEDGEVLQDAASVPLRDDQGYPLWRTARALRIGQANQSTP